MSEPSGRFIVIEGLDGAGTTTQAMKLHKALQDRGMESVLTREPTDGPVGRLIRDILAGRVAAGATNRPTEFSEETLCLLFAADRLEHSRAIGEMRRRHTHIICDRYIWSSMAYQSRDGRVPPERVVDTNRGCVLPDLTILLDVPAAECIERLGKRSGRPSIYEKREFLDTIEERYAATRPLYTQHFGRLVTIDGTRSIDTVHEAIVAAVETHLEL